MSEPRTAIWKHGRISERVRILEYIGQRRWLVLDRNDGKRIIHAENLTFTKQ